MWLLDDEYRSPTLISRRRFNLIERLSRVREASRSHVHFSRVSPSRACLYTCTRNVVSALIGDHVDYRWSMGKRDLLSRPPRGPRAH